MPQSTTSSDGFVADDGFVPEPDTEPRGFLHGLASTTIAPLRAMARPPTIAEVALGPGAPILLQTGRKLLEAYRAARAGKGMEAVASTLEAVPIAGPISETISGPINRGDIAGAAGAATGLLALPAAGKVVEIAPAVGRAVKAGTVAAAPDVATGLVKSAVGAGVGSLAGEVPGVGHVARWVFAYPGAKQVATGVGKGATAAYEAFKGAAPVAAAAEDTALLDGIAGNLARGKKFADLEPAEQAVARGIADRIKGAPPPGASSPTGQSSIPAVVADPNREFVPPPPRYPQSAAQAPPPEVAGPAPATEAPATEPLPAATAPQPAEASAPQVSGTTASESLRPSGVVPKSEATAPQWITEDGLSRYAADNAMDLEQARAALEQQGFQAVGRSHLNRALHGVGNEMGLDHDALSQKATQDFGVKLLTQLNQDQLLSMYDDLQSKRSISEPLKPKPERALTGPEAKKLAEFLAPGGITAADLPRMTPEHWKIAAQGAGVRVPPQNSIAKVGAELGKIQGKRFKK